MCSSNGKELAAGQLFQSKKARLLLILCAIKGPEGRMKTLKRHYDAHFVFESYENEMGSRPKFWKGCNWSLMQLTAFLELY
jgi:hypothetical protein